MGQRRLYSCVPITAMEHPPRGHFGLDRRVAAHHRLHLNLLSIGPASRGPGFRYHEEHQHQNRRSRRPVGGPARLTGPAAEDHTPEREGNNRSDG
ncbi:hypothetical protein PHJA_000575500 [Phtheirospermum japonicum]|uniref:Uncharacterized protein n=1 Tax=Phtheirospermum japonicum TaxID=374723 RepID=A0A830BGS4_9LAMI|nr:hypothetical protein PHJA_000575500 [Phtheirospermum japonicum]